MARPLQHDDPDLAALLGAADARDADYDALAELFLGAPGATTPSAAERPAPTTPAAVAHAAPPRAAANGRPARAEIEALVLGHLPVMSSAWASQYAAAAARYEERPIAVLRLAAGAASVEVFGESAPPQAHRDHPTSLEQAVRLTAARTGRWIVRVDATDELAVAASPLARSVTLLAGADEAAVVAAYRTLKALSGSPIDAPESAPGATLRVAIMGADDARAAVAASKLQQACAAFLDRPLEAAAPVGRIGPVRSSRVFSGHAGLDAVAAMRVIAEAVVTSRAPDRAAESRPNPAAGADLANGANWVESPPSPTGGDPDASSCVQPRSLKRQNNGASAIEGGSDALLSDVLLRAAPVTPREAGAALSELMTGFTPLPVRCPYDESVELATDADGALQLLARAGDRAVESLVAVADWAAAHGALLALACPSLRTAGGARPVQRLFADRAAQVRRLLDSGIRLHLVARVVVDGREGRTCIELN